MTYTLKTLLALKELCHELCGKCEYCWIDEAQGLANELRDYVDFVDRAKRTHGIVPEIDIKYKVYKKILGDDAPLPHSSQTP